MTSPALVPELTDDLAAEHDAVDALLADLAPSDWDSPTPSAGWTIRDQIDHLAFGDSTATVALLDPAGYQAGWAERAQNGPGFAATRAAAARARSPHQLYVTWRNAASELIAAVSKRPDPSQRVPWAGRELSVPTLLTARLMETWAHGHDVAAALGRDPVPSMRLRHIARLGVSTRGYSYARRELPVPPDELRLELLAPDGSTWRHGPDDAADRVTGSMLEFCLVVTRRRDWTGTALDARGPHAAEWLAIAQAYVG